MKLTNSVAISALCWTARLASAATAHIYTYDSAEAGRRLSGGLLDQITRQLRLDTPHVLSPVEARVVLAQRAGVEDYHVQDLGRSGVLEAVNQFGLKQPLFGTDDTTRITILAEETEESTLSMKRATHLNLTPAPSFKSARKLFSDLEIQHAWPSPPPERLSASATADDYTSESRFTLIRGSKQELEHFWQRIVDSPEGADATHIAVTMLVFPPSAISDVDDKSQWASGYSMPGAQTLAKRQDTTSFSTLVTRQDNSQNSPLPGILPACYTSQSDCESTTRNCTGHGSCKLLYTDKSHGDDSRPCYACACSATVTENSQGQKSTTYWGGPACQKKDISLQFWLLALFSVGLVSLITFAIGNLWSMGEETLPSVIGAGVSGPTARR